MESSRTFEVHVRSPVPSPPLMYFSSSRASSTAPGRSPDSRARNTLSPSPAWPHTAGIARSTPHRSSGSQVPASGPFYIQLYSNSSMSSSSAGDDNVVAAATLSVDEVISRRFAHRC
ncbi:hypothetical protein B0H19DRAFT_1274588 [Mycena capillaripes]|nr:hypothetical protein B0H19DRAFT_1274588 [Mycena capillaripes]